MSESPRPGDLNGQTDLPANVRPFPKPAAVSPTSAQPTPSVQPAPEAVRVGTAKGPGARPHEFTFITPDTDQLVKNGEFVFYQALGQDVLARVIGREAVRLYPDAYLGDPSIAPADVARMLGYDGESCELFEVTASVVGYWDNHRGLVNPRIPPRVGSPIFLAPSATLAQVLNKRQPGQMGGVELGWMLSRQAGEVPIVLSAREFTSTHLAIIAGTGAGKSYTAGVLIEELLKPATRASILVLDPHGEYRTLSGLENRPEFADGDYRARIEILKPDQVKIRHSALRLSDLRALLPNLSEPMYSVLREAYEMVQKEGIGRGGEERWTFHNLLAVVDKLRERYDGDRSTLAGSASALRWRLVDLDRSSRIFNEAAHQQLSDVLKPGQCTVVPLDEADVREQRVVASVLLRRLFDGRQGTVRGTLDQRDDLYLPYPVFVLLEEAHTFAPAGTDGEPVVSARILRQILAEGRKFGIGIGLISQRPGKLDSDVLSQCMTQIVMRIVNPIDQQTVAQAVESASREALDELPALSRGQAIVLGSSLHAPVMVAVRERLSTHGGQDIDAPKVWTDWFSAENKARRARDQAAPPPPPPPGQGFGGRGLEDIGYDVDPDDE
ncbi:MAG: ATP-binding protein [Chloroflexi bacterium]|nr:ATP-binding protein [Chloroflexota bacterium]